MFRVGKKQYLESFSGKDYLDCAGLDGAQVGHAHPKVIIFSKY